MAHDKWASKIHEQLSSIQHDVATYEQEYSEIKRLQPLHAGLRKGLSMCLKAVESFLQPDFKKRRCLHCNGQFESVAAMLRKEPANGIGWCDRCTFGPTASSAEDETSSNESDSEPVAKATKPKHKPTQRRRKLKHHHTSDAAEPEPETAEENPPKEHDGEASNLPPEQTEGESLSPAALELLAPLPDRKETQSASDALALESASNSGVLKTKRKRKGGPRPGKSKKKKTTLPGELKSYQIDKKAIVLAQIRSSAEQIVSRLPTVWIQKGVQAEYEQHKKDGELLTETLSFVPGQSSNPFAGAAEACKMYVQQSAFGRKMDLRARYACGRCARPFNSYSPGGPNRIESASARRQVAQRDIDFKQFCAQFLHVTAQVVRAEVYFSLLCDECPPLLAAVTQSDKLFSWTSFIDHTADAFRIWQSLLTQPRLAQQPTDLVPVSEDADDDDYSSDEEGGHVLLLEPPNLDCFSQLVLAATFGSQDASSSSNEQSMWDALVQAASHSEADVKANGAEMTKVCTDVTKQQELCAICRYNLDMEHEVLDKDDEIPRKRLISVARELREKMPQVAYRRVQLDCKHEFCYVCAVCHYLQSGNKCPICRKRFTHIAARPVADRDGSQALARRSRTQPD